MEITAPEGIESTATVIDDRAETSTDLANPPAEQRSPALSNGRREERGLF